MRLSSRLEQKEDELWYSIISYGGEDIFIQKIGSKTQGDAKIPIALIRTLPVDPPIEQKTDGEI